MNDEMFDGIGRYVCLVGELLRLHPSIAIYWHDGTLHIGSHIVGLQGQSLTEANWQEAVKAIAATLHD